MHKGQYIFKELIRFIEKLESASGHIKLFFKLESASGHVKLGSCLKCKRTHPGAYTLLVGSARAAIHAAQHQLHCLATT